MEYYERIVNNVITFPNKNEDLVPSVTTSFNKVKNYIKNLWPILSFFQDIPVLPYEKFYFIASSGDIYENPIHPMITYECHSKNHEAALDLHLPEAIHYSYSREGLLRKLDNLPVPTMRYYGLFDISDKVYYLDKKIEQGKISKVVIKIKNGELFTKYYIDTDNDTYKEIVFRQEEDLRAHILGSFKKPYTVAIKDKKNVETFPIVDFAHIEDAKLIQAKLASNLNIPKSEGLEIILLS